MLIITAVIGSTVNLRKTQSCRIGNCPFNQQPPVIVSAVIRLHKQRAQPRTKIHPTDKVVGNQTRAAGYFFAVKRLRIHQQIPQRKPVRIRSVAYTVVIDHHTVRCCPDLLEISDIVIQPIEIFMQRKYLHSRPPSAIYKNYTTFPSRLQQIYATTLCLTAENSSGIIGTKKPAGFYFIKRV